MKRDSTDRIFSRYIRIRDADYEGMITCISCGRKHPWNEAHCGHYIIRSHMATRYDEHNCNAQCVYCNYHLKGNVIGYREGLIIKIGIAALDKLEAKKHTTAHFSEADLTELRRCCRAKIRKMLKEGKEHLLKMEE